jgi:hypothetical protein
MFPIYRNQDTQEQRLYDPRTHCSYTFDGTPIGCYIEKENWQLIAWARCLYAWQRGETVAA